MRRILSAGGPIAKAAMANAKREKEKLAWTNAGKAACTGIGMAKFASPKQMLAHQEVHRRATV